MPLRSQSCECDIVSSDSNISLSIELFYFKIFSYIEDSPIYHCRQVRSVDDDTDNTPPARTAVGNGALTYNMDIVAGVLGGNTEVTMSPNFGFAGISARYVLIPILSFQFFLEKLLFKSIC